MVSYGFLDCDAVGVLNLLEQKNFSEVKSHSLIWDWFLQTFSGIRYGNESFLGLPHYEADASHAKETST